MAENIVALNPAKRLKYLERKTFPSINQVLPTEILKIILEKLDFKSLGQAKQTCKHWKVIINEFKLVHQASSKYEIQNDRISFACFFCNQF